MTRSIIVALPHIHFNDLGKKTVLVGVVIGIVIVSVANSTIPHSSTDQLQKFEKGEPFRLDVVIAPFHAAGFIDQSCVKVARDFSERLAELLIADPRQGTAFWGPQQVIDTLGQASQSAQSIAQYATDRQADIIFYGEAECDSQAVTIHPQVHVSDAFYAGLPELDGFYNFDDIINPLKIDLSKQQLDPVVSQQAARAAALVNIGHGFRMFATEVDGNLKQASDLFMQLAAGQLTDRHGLAMLWYAIGKAQLNGVIDTCSIVDTKRLDLAESSLFTALQHEPEFALAHAYLGVIAAYKASLLSDDQADVIQTVLNKSMARFQRARSALVQPDNGLAKAIAAIGEAQTLITLHDLKPHSSESTLLMNKALVKLNEIINRSDGINYTSKEAQSILARAYAIMGDVQHAQSNDDRALSYFNAASVLTEDNWLKTAVHLSMAELYTVRGNACLASQHYQSATQHACELDKREFALQAQQMQFYCQQTNDTPAR